MKTVLRNILFDEDVATGGSWDINELNPLYWLSLHPNAYATSVVTVDIGAESVTEVSGFNQTATQTTDALQPAYLPTGFNGFPCLDFDGVNDFLNFSVPQAYNQVVMAVIDTTNIGAGFRLFLNRVSGSEAGLYVGSDLSYKASIYWGVTRAVQSAETRDKAIYFWQIGGNGSGFNKTDVNAQNLISEANTQTAISSWNNVNFFSVSQSSAIKLAELVMLDNPSQADIDKVHGIFAHRWWREAGQPVPLAPSHPYYLSPP